MIKDYSSAFASYSLLPEFAAIEYIALYSLEQSRLLLLTEHKADKESTYWQPNWDVLLKTFSTAKTGTMEILAAPEKPASEGPQELPAETKPEEQSASAAPTPAAETPKKPIHYRIEKLETDCAELYLVLQAHSEITVSTGRIFSFIAVNLASISTMTYLASQERFRSELLKLREFQARLFPKFTSISTLDISSVYLPADLMSGNFIDAFNISQSVYQIVLCSIGGYDAQSSFIGASIRTIVRTNSSPKFAPSSLIKFTLERVEKIVHGLHSMISLTIIQFNINSGDTRISSYGSPNVIFASKSHKKAYNLNDSQAGKDLAKRVAFKDMLIHVEPEDTILYFSSGVTMAANTKGELFGKERLVQQFAKSMFDPSLVITQAISEAIYSFTDYGSTQEDIILVAVKRK